MDVCVWVERAVMEAVGVAVIVYVFVIVGLYWNVGVQVGD